MFSLACDTESIAITPGYSLPAETVYTQLAFAIIDALTRNGDRASALVCKTLVHAQVVTLFQRDTEYLA